MLRTRFFSTVFNPFATLSQSPVTVLSRLPAKTLYDQSIVLLGATALRNELLYRDTLSSMKKTFEETPDISSKAWMKGRVAQAATDAGDYKTAETAVSDAKRILLKEPKVDACHAWTLGYLASINKNEYEQQKTAMLDAASQLTEPSDTLWAHVMSVQAAARAGDPQTFYTILERMKSSTRTASVPGALAHIPENDWQAWALGITAKASIVMNNQKLYHDLVDLLNMVTHRAIAKGLMGNALMAHINATDAAGILEQQKQIAETSAPTPGPRR